MNAKILKIASVALPVIGAGFSVLNNMVDKKTQDEKIEKAAAKAVAELVKDK